MTNKKKSFLLHIDSLDILDDLTNGQAGVLFKAIKAYQKGEELELDSIVKIAFSPFKNQFTRDNIKYENLCEKNRLIAINRHKNKSTSGRNGNDTSPTVTKSTDNDSKKDSDNKRDSKRKVFTPPTTNEVFNYMVERGLTSKAESEKFFDYYSSKGWVVGRAKMKDWKAAVRNWLKNNFSTNNNQPQKPKEFSQ